RQIKPRLPSADADLGVTTIAGERAGVVTRGEVRALPVYGPGGYIWQPVGGDTVLVIKGGTGGEEQCVAGAQQAAAPQGMQPGEVYLYVKGGGAVYLKGDGTVELQGSVAIEGSLTVNGKPYKPCTCGSPGGV
ncbi:MAG: hypothetical protein RRY97_08205, partial [Oscillibacter sp.]